MMHTANRRASTQCNSGTETNSDCELSPNTTDIQQIDMAVDNKINSELADSHKKGDSKTDMWQINTVKQIFVHDMGE